MIAFGNGYLAEVRGLRPDSTIRAVTSRCTRRAKKLSSSWTRNWCRYRQLKKLEAERLENYVIPLAIRLQFEFAAPHSEICPLEWDWIDLEKRRVVWPGSKTGGISKPMSEEAYRLLSSAPSTLR